jgi:hypothetical protein
MRGIICFLSSHKEKVVDTDSDGNIILVCERCKKQSYLLKGSILWGEWKRGLYP